MLPIDVHIIDTLVRNELIVTGPNLLFTGVQVFLITPTNYHGLRTDGGFAAGSPQSVSAKQKAVEDVLNKMDFCSGVGGSVDKRVVLRAAINRPATLIP